MVVVSVGGQDYYINKKLKANWDRIRGQKLVKQDDDRVFIVDGRERSGKSVFAIQQGAYLDPTLVEGDLKRICFSPKEFLNAIRTANPGEVVIFDEAFRGLSSRGAISKINKLIVQAMMEMGQKNLIVFIVSPSFFMLDLYVAMLRSHALFHIKKDKGSNKRYFRVYNESKKGRMYQQGVKKGWEYTVPTRFKDTFPNKYPGGAVFEAKYRAKKLKALEEMEKFEDKKEEEGKFKAQRDKILALFQKKLHLTSPQLSQTLKEVEIDLSESSLRQISIDNRPKVPNVPQNVQS